MGGLGYSRSKDLKYVVQCTENNYLVKNDFITLDSTDLVTFTDWTFLDSLRHKLKEFYDLQFGFDSLNVRMGSITIGVDTLGNITNYLLIIPKQYSSLYSLEKVESLVDLIKNYHFILPDYEKPVHRVFKESERVKNLNTFSFFSISYLFKQNGNIATTWDARYERQLNKMLLGNWCDKEGKNFIFYKSSASVYAKMLNPLTGIIGDFDCNFREGRLYMYFDQETPSIMSYKFVGDRLTLSGVVGNRKVVWELKKTASVP